MPPSLSLVLGMVVLALAFRTYAHPLAQRLSALCVLVASFLAGYLPARNWGAGVLLASLWLLVPWLEILTRVRALRLPLDRTLGHRPPPNREAFPNLAELTAEIEDERFEHVDDVGCDWAAQRQYLRLFYRRDDRLQAAICLVDQGNVSFYYVSLMTRTLGGEVFVTWNYPFAYSLKFVPKTRIWRVRAEEPFAAMCATHADRLTRVGVADGELRAFEPEQMQEIIQGEFSAQMRHNVAAGLLALAPGGGVRYTWRGMIYLWLRSIWDFVRP